MNPLTIGFVDELLKIAHWTNQGPSPMPPKPTHWPHNTDAPPPPGVIDERNRHMPRRLPVPSGAGRPMESSVGKSTRMPVVGPMTAVKQHVGRLGQRA